MFSLDGSSKSTFSSKKVTRAIPIFLTQSRCMHSDKYSKILIPAQLHDIVKYQNIEKNAKLLINVRCNHMRKVFSTFYSHWYYWDPQKEKTKILINKKVMSNWSWPGFANWWNLYILLLCNQKSQEADIQNYLLL